MATITLKGNPVQTSGALPEVGTKAPEFTLTNLELSDVSLKDFAGQKVILNVFPSIDTPTCASSVRRFNEEASKIDNTVVLCIARDLPFAFKRFCGAEEIESVIPLSEFRTQAFGKDYGLSIIDGPLAGLFSRAIIVLNENGEVLYTEQVAEIADEPNYSAALEKLQ